MQWPIKTTFVLWHINAKAAAAAPSLLLYDVVSERKQENHISLKISVRRRRLIQLPLLLCSGSGLNKIII